MKLDLDLVKVILEKCEEQVTISSLTHKLCEIIVDENCKEEYVLYHMGLLIENGFLKGEKLPYILTSRGYSQISFPTSLTLNGHQLLEAMRSDKLWSRIKKSLGNVGIDSLKQIPALALQLFLS